MGPACPCCYRFGKGSLNHSAAAAPHDPIQLRQFRAAYAQVRRRMEEENRRAQKAARKEYMDNVRELAAFVRKRDKRVSAFQVRYSWSLWLLLCFIGVVGIVLCC